MKRASRTDAETVVKLFRFGWDENKIARQLQISNIEVMQIVAGDHPYNFEDIRPGREEKAKQD